MDKSNPIPEQALPAYTKQQFVYECAMRAFQGSFSNPSHQASIASIVRGAEQLWDELQEWERLEQAKNSQADNS